MPQLSLYIDQDTLDKVTNRARSENVSVSKLVTSILSRDLADTWSPKFLATLGSIQDPTFVEPDDIDPSLDVPRQEL